MQVTTADAKPSAIKADVLVVGVGSSEVSKSKALAAVDELVGGALKKAVKDEDFKGAPGSQVVVTPTGDGPIRRVAVVGTGPKEGPVSVVVDLAACAVRLGNRVGAKHVAVWPNALPVEAQQLGALLGRGAALGNYRFTKYVSKPGRAPTVNKFTAMVDDKAAAVKKGLSEGVSVAVGVELARDLVNEPAGEIFPASFAKRATSLARETGLKVKVHDHVALKRMKMGMLLAVGRGSTNPPRLVHLTYTPKKKPKKTICLVGKGVTFDSGGLDIKPPDAMLEMKIDMAGAAAVMGTMRAVAALQPDVAVHGICTLAENMPGANAYKPGDVLTAASGRTVEVNNTDAEGRLCLGDALHYAVGLKPDLVIDIATLTGACMVALGPYTTGMFSKEDKIAQALVDAATTVGEDIWRLPLLESLKEQLKSDIADTKNTGQRFGGAITAGLFLSEFVGDTPWAHLDIAGPSNSSKDSGYITKGGTGVMVATLSKLITEY